MSSNDRESYDMSTPKRDGDPPIKIVRELPLPWVIVTLAVVIGFGFKFYNEQIQQGKDLIAANDKMDKALVLMTAYREEINDLKYELRDVKRRVTDLEGVKR